MFPPLGHNPALTPKRGFSLLETMIALLVVSIGLLAVAMQATLSARESIHAYQRGTAAIHARSLSFLIRLGALEGVGIPHRVTAGDPDPALGRLGLMVSMDLPGGIAVVCRDATPFDGSVNLDACDGTGAVVVKVFWVAPDSQSGDDAGRLTLMPS